MKRGLCGQDDHQPSGMCQELITVLARCRHTPVITILGSPRVFCVTGTPGVSSVTICCSLLLMINNPNIVDENWAQLPRLIPPPGLFICLLAFCPRLLIKILYFLWKRIWNVVVVVDCKAKSSPLRNWFATLCFPSENPSKVYKNRPIPSVISGRDQRFARDQNGETIREIVAVMTWQRTWTDCVSLVLLTLGCFVAISESSGSYTTMIGTIHNMNREHSHHNKKNPTNLGLICILNNTLGTQIVFSIREIELIFYCELRPLS